MSARLLIVDDEPNLVELMSRYLGRLGYQTETCHDGPSALALFQSDPNRFSIVVTDLSLPGLNGEDLIEGIRRIRPEIPAIITSGYPHEPRAARVGFLQKPFLPHALAEAIDLALKESA